MIASVWLWLQGRLPLRSTEFLDDAHTRGALRRNRRHLPVSDTHASRTDWDRPGPTFRRRCVERAPSPRTVR